MLDRVLDLREDVIKHLNEEGVIYSDKIVDMIVDEFGENIEDYERKNNYTVGRTSKTYEKLLLRAVREVFKENRNVIFGGENGYVRINSRYSEFNTSKVRVEDVITR